MYQRTETIFNCQSRIPPEVTTRCIYTSTLTFLWLSGICFIRLPPITQTFYKILLNYKPFSPNPEPEGPMRDKKLSFLAPTNAPVQINTPQLLCASQVRTNTLWCSLARILCESKDHYTSNVALQKLLCANKEKLTSAKVQSGLA